MCKGGGDEGGKCVCGDCMFVPYGEAVDRKQRMRQCKIYRIYLFADFFMNIFL